MPSARLRRRPRYPGRRVRAAAAPRSFWPRPSTSRSSCASCSSAPRRTIRCSATSRAAPRCARSPGRPQLIIAPNFRADWATADARVDGHRALPREPALRAAAAQLFGSDLVDPWGVYSNITWQLPFDQGGGHTDVPAFVGVDRRRYPTWLLAVMGHSRLFEKERVEIATAVAWFYRGKDGGFTLLARRPGPPAARARGRPLQHGDPGRQRSHVSPRAPGRRAARRHARRHDARYAARARRRRRLGHPPGRRDARADALRRAAHQRLVEGLRLPRRRAASAARVRQAAGSISTRWSTASAPI